MTLISSSSNPTIKRLRALRQRKERESTGHFWVEGLRLVGEAVELSAPIETVVVAPDLLVSDFGKDVVERAREGGIQVLDVTDSVFAGLSSKEGPQGIAAVVRQQWHYLPDPVPAGGFWWLALDSVADPGNLGTIMRTCDAVGVSGIILIGDSTDPYDPAAVRGSMGAIFTTAVVRTSESEFIAWARDRTVNVVGTSDRGAVDYREAAYPQPLVVLMGSERHGLPSSLLGVCGEVVRIPMVGRSDSLNLAVATGVVLYEVFGRTDRTRTPVDG